AIDGGNSDLSITEFLYNATIIEDISDGEVVITGEGIGDIEDATISVSSSEVNFGDEINIAISTSELATYWGVISYQFNLAYDSSIVEYDSYNLAETLSDGGMLTINDSNPGELIVGFMTTIPLSGEGTLLNIDFTVVSGGESSLNISEFMYNTTYITNITDGSITVNNQVPYLENPLEDITFEEDTSYSEIDLNNVFADGDLEFGDEFSFSYEGNTELDIEIDSGIVTLTPTENWFGSETITFTATDLTGDFASDEVIITVENVNDSSEIISFLPEEQEIEVVEESLIDFSVTAEDIDSEIAYSWYINDELQEEVDECNFSHDFTENGEYEVKSIVSDEEFELETIWNITVQINSNEEEGVIPLKTELVGNYPNPFNPTTSIKFGIHQDTKVKIDIYNLLGQKIITLVNSEMTAGYHSIEWNGKGRTGQRTASGIYYYKMSTKDSILIDKMILLK
ncbi:MAG: T9SS type A sorting domain-containing protein, partial [Candidatus Cloacimonadota bacterium]|nr:T9SS type A sorting domain-containing protein [Candidatus Cloacimonadota bacterium]